MDKPYKVEEVSFLSRSLVETRLNRLHGEGYDLIHALEHGGGMTLILRRRESRELNPYAQTILESARTIDLTVQDHTIPPLNEPVGFDPDDYPVV